MKPLINIMFLVLLVSFTDIISGGTTEERRRAATVSALSRDQELPPQLLRLIASNGHLTRDCEQPEMGFFPQNEWKALKRVFKHNERTAAIRHVIDLYDDARTAWQKSPQLIDARGNHTKVSWWKDQREDGHLLIWIRSKDGPLDSTTHVMLNEVQEIIELAFTRFDEKSIGDLSNLPPNLRMLGIDRYDGDLTKFEFSKLPKGLGWLTHPGPDAESTLHVQSLPPGLDTLEVRAYGMRRKEDPLEVHFNLPLPQGLKVRAPRMDGFVFHPEPAQMNKIEGGRSWETIWEVKWDDGSQIQVIVG